MLLGTVGGIGLLVGPAGLLWLQPAAPSAARRRRRSSRWTCGFIALLFLTSASGLALLALRATRGAMALLLCRAPGRRDGAVRSRMPYGKFAHGIYRSAALLKWAIERRQPNRLRLGSE